MCDDATVMSCAFRGSIDCVRKCTGLQDIQSVLGYDPSEPSIADPWQLLIALPCVTIAEASPAQLTELIHTYGILMHETKYPLLVDVLDSDIAVLR